LEDFLPQNNTNGILEPRSRETKAKNNFRLGEHEMKRNISILVFLIALVCVEIFLNHSYNNTIVYGIGLAILLVIGGILIARFGGPIFNV